MRPVQYSMSVGPVKAMIVVLAIVLISPPSPTMAKRFDCQMFCRTTGFSGMVGGCRCSFTLFTAKRSTRDHNSVPEENLPYLEDEQQLQQQQQQQQRQQYPRIEDVSLVDLLRMARETHEGQSVEEPEDIRLEAPSRLQKNLNLVQAMPKDHPVRVLAKPNNAAAENSSTHRPRSTRQGRSPPQQLVAKRREFEQDLDNGDTSDYLRLPY